ncbi:hypothetical protein HO839_00150 [Streptococcus suis]|nr:hypothetical protein [Streptococcus suis]
MFKFQLPNANEWFYFYGCSEAVYPLVMLNLPNIANNIFPGITKKKLYVVDAGIVGAPVAFSDNDIIFLSTEGSELYARNVYQVAHELCHFYINSSQKQRTMFWFEEVICEVASHYFLEEYSKQNIWDENSRSISYLQYSEDNLLEVEVFNHKRLVKYQSDEINHLIQNPTDRPKNRYLATLLLPVFKEFPSLFAELPKLANLYGIPDFELFLKAWQDAVADKNKSAIQKVIEIFY